MRIIFVRHGEPNYEKDCLTESGRLHAINAAMRLKGENIERIFSSPQGRAVETARECAKALGLKIDALDFMREIHWGSISGRDLFAGGHPWNCADQMIREGFDFFSEDWESHRFFKDNFALRCVKNVQSGFDGFTEALGYRREGKYYRNTGESPNQKTAALFSHGGSSTAALSQALNLPFPYLCALLHMPFAGIIVLKFDPEPGSLCLPHIEKLVNGGETAA